jgi:hypothetical protein
VSDQQDLQHTERAGQKPERDWRKVRARFTEPRRLHVQGNGSHQMKSGKVPASAIWALGVTQIIGYGTLYYSYSLLAPAMAEELAWSREWVFAVLSVALFASALLAPVAGHWADRFGAGRLMVPGSAAAAVALLLCALAPGRIGFVAGVLAMELASCFVLYSTAFVALVQLGGGNAQRHHSPDPDRRVRFHDVLAVHGDAARASELAGSSRRVRRAQPGRMPPAPRMGCPALTLYTQARA